MLSEAAKAQVEAHEQTKRDRLRAGSGALIDSRLGARTLGDFLIVEPGCEVYARAGTTGMMRPGDDDPGSEGVQARGGIVLDITDVTEITDDGEIIRQRAFRTFDTDPRLQLHEAFTTLTEAQVDPSRFATPEPNTIRHTYRRLCRYVADRRGVASPFEIDLVQDAARLAAIVGQRGAR